MKTITLTFKIKELFDDIEGDSFVNGYLMGDDAEPRKHTTIDILTEGNKELVWRRMKLAAAEVGEILYAYTKNPNTEKSADDTLGDAQDFVYTLNVRDDFSQTTVTLLIEYIHAYIVNRVLYYWTLKTNPEASEIYHIEVEDAKEKINAGMNKATKGKRITMSPF